MIKVYEWGQRLQLFYTYPSQLVKISIHSCTFLKNFPIWRLMPFQYIPFFLMLIYLVIYFVINSCANTPSAQSVSAERQEFCIWISCASSYGARLSFPSMPWCFLQVQPAIKAWLLECAIWLPWPCICQCRKLWM